MLLLFVLVPIFIPLVVEDKPQNNLFHDLNKEKTEIKKSQAFCASYPHPFLNIGKTKYEKSEGFCDSYPHPYMIPLGEEVKLQNHCNQHLNKEEPVIEKLQSFCDSYPHPFLVEIMILRGGKEEVCSGALIDVDFVLTAAHCFNRIEVTDPIWVGFNVQSRSKTKITDRIKLNHSDVRKHEKFDYNKEYKECAQYDIALLKLSSSVTLNESVNVINILEIIPNKTLKIDEIKLFGYGKRNNTSDYASDTPKCTPLKYNDYNEKILIVKNATNIVPCEGDSGGPVVTGDSKLVGILIAGPPNCFEATKFKVLLLHTFDDWIKSIIPNRSLDDTTHVTPNKAKTTLYNITIIVLGILCVLAMPAVL